MLRASSGRRSGSRCVKPSKARRGARRCTLLTRVGSATHRDVAGVNRVRFTARVKGRRLSAGSYRLQLVAKSGFGVSSRPRTLSFTVVP